MSGSSTKQNWTSHCNDRINNKNRRTGKWVFKTLGCDWIWQWLRKHRCYTPQLQWLRKHRCYTPQLQGKAGLLAGLGCHGYMMPGPQTVCQHPARTYCRPCAVPTRNKCQMPLALVSYAATCQLLPHVFKKELRFFFWQLMVSQPAPMYGTGTKMLHHWTLSFNIKLRTCSFKFFKLEIYDLLTCSG